jgi:hypothetical protein
MQATSSLQGIADADFISGWRALEPSTTTAALVVSTDLGGQVRHVEYVLSEAMKVKRIFFSPY